MEIRNNSLVDIKKQFIHDLLNFYNENEATQLLTILIEHFFGISRNELILNSGHRLSESEILKLHKAVKELMEYKPVQYITGVVEFHGLKLRVSPDVLIPRPETEELVQLVMEVETGRGLTIIDIGTGSGCIAIGLSKLLKKAKVHASDISENAIGLARKNADSNNQDVIFHGNNILNNEEPIVNSKREKIKFDIIVSNPPYVTLNDKKKMHRNVVDYEPHEALFVPNGDPLIYFRAILEFAEIQLNTGGRVYVEINESLGNSLINLFSKYNYSEISLVKDIHDKFRFIKATKS